MFPNDLWIADPHANKLFKVVDDVVQSTTFNTNNNPRSILVSQDMTSVYVVNRDANSITQYRSGAEIRDIYVGKMPYGICEDSKRNVYVTNYQDNTVTKITGSKVVATIAVDAGPRGITCDENDDIYVACFLSSTVVKISSDTNVASIQVGQNPEGITCDSNDNIWVACYGSNIVSKIVRGIKTLDIEVNKGPVAVVSDTAGTVYTANYYSDDVSMIATNSNGTITVTNIPVGEGPTAIAVNRENAVYVTSGLGTDVRKIVEGAVVDTIEVCDNPSAFGDFTGCSAYNVFNAVPSGGESIGVPSGGWKITDLESGIQDALNKVIAGVSPTTADNVSYEKSTMIGEGEDAEEEILNITVRAALDELYTQQENINDPDKILVTDLGKTLTVKLDELDASIANAATKTELQSVSTIANNAATQTQLNDVATIANNAATKEQLNQVSQVANAAAKQTDFNKVVSRVETIEATYNKPANIIVASETSGNVTLDQKLASMDADIKTRATTVALNAVKTTADAAAPQTALDAVDERVVAIEEVCNKPENIIVGTSSTPGAQPEDPPVVSNITLADKLTALDEKDTDLDTRVTTIEGAYNDPEQIIVDTEEVPNENDNPESETVTKNITLADKLTRVDAAIDTKADEATVTEELTGVKDRVTAIEEVYNKPSEIIVDHTGDDGATEVSLADKLEEIDTKFTTDEATISDHEERLAAVEADYNKPDKIIVGQVTGEDPDDDGPEEAPVTNVTLTQKLTEIDGKFTTQDEANTAMDGRVAAIEAVYNKPENIIVGQVPSEEEPETSVDVNLTTKLGEIDTEVEEVKGLAEAAAKQEDFLELSQQVSTNEEALEALRGKYDATKSVVDGLEASVATIQTDMNDPTKIIVGQSEEETPSDVSLANKLTEMDATIAAKAEQTALDEVKATADAAATQVKLDAVDTRLQTVETNYNNPDMIIIDADSDTNLTTKLESIDTSVEDHETRLATVEAAYNKPDQIQVDTVEDTPVYLNTKLDEIDAAFDTKVDTTAIADMATNASVAEDIAEATADMLTKTEAGTVYATKEGLTTATTDMATNASVDTKLADYAKTVDVDSKITAAVSGLQWKTSVANIAALKAITTPAEGWTVSVDDTNSVYRYDAQSAEAGDDDKFIKANDGTEGAWVKLSTAFYSVATTSTDGLMSAADKTKLDTFTNGSDYLTVANASTTYLGIHAKADTAALADNATNLNGHADTYFATSDALTAVGGRVTTVEGFFTEGKANTALALEGFTQADYATNASVDGKLANYVTTEAMNTALDGKVDDADIADMLTKTEAGTTYATKTALTDGLATKADTTAIADMATNASVDGKLANYVTTETATDTYATQTALTGGLATKADTTAIADMLTKTEAGSTYATKGEVTSAVENMNDPAHIVVGQTEEDPVTNITLADKLASMDADLEELKGASGDGIVLAENVQIEEDTTLVDKLDTIDSAIAAKADTSAISDMLTKTEAGSTYATIASLNGKVDDADIADMATNTSVDEKLANKANTSAISDMLTKTEAGSTYATKSELSAKADSSALSAYATTESLAGYVQTGAISDMLTKTEAGTTYATKTALTDGLAAKADTTALAGYVQTSAIADMATNTSVDGKLANKADTSAISDMLTKTEAGSTYATKAELGGYATTSALNAKADASAIADMATNTSVNEKLANKADSSALANYATTESLADYVQTEAISDMLTKTEAGSTYATKAELSGYATTSALNAKADSSALANYATTEAMNAALGNKADTSAIANMNNPENIMISDQTLTATITALQSEIASLKERISALESPSA